MSGPNGKMYIEKLVELNEIVAIDYNIGPSRENTYFPEDGQCLVGKDKHQLTVHGGINWYSPEEAKVHNVKFHKTLEKGTFKYTFEESAFSFIHELAHFYDHVNGRNMYESIWDMGDDSVPKVSESEKYAMHVENIIRVEHGSDIRIRYRDSKGFSSGNDFVIDVNTGRALFFMAGNIFDTQIINLEKHEQGYKYK